MFALVDKDLGARIQAATEAQVVTNATPTKSAAPGMTAKMQNMKLADLHAKKQSGEEQHNFDLFAHKTWNLHH